MTKQSHKIQLVAVFLLLLLFMVTARDFIYYRKGWHTLTLQFRAVYFLVRLFTLPFVAVILLKYFTGKHKLISLVLRHLLLFTAFFMLFVALSYFFCTIWSVRIDNRNLNLFNTIRYESFTENIFFYLLLILSMHLWCTLEQQVYVERKLNSGEPVDQTELNAPIADSQIKPIRDKIIHVKSGNRTFSFSPEEIIFLKSKGPYVQVQTIQGSFLLRITLTKLEGELPQNFLRLHRSHIVNIEYVREIRSLLNGDSIVTLRTGTMLRCSRTYKGSLTLLRTV